MRLFFVQFFELQYMSCWSLDFIKIFVTNCDVKLTSNQAFVFIYSCNERMCVFVCVCVCMYVCVCMCGARANFSAVCFISR